jgi:hypothetical protein
MERFDLNGTHQLLVCVNLLDKNIIRRNIEALVLNVVVEWLAFLLRIREVPGSDLGPETSYPD